jgi:hypothetical protein
MGHIEFWWRNLLESGHFDDWGDGEHNIKMDITETGCEDGQWMELTWYHAELSALALAVSNLNWFR